MSAVEQIMTHRVAERPFPDAAARLRRCAPTIIARWDSAVRTMMPKADELTRKQVRNSIPHVLEQLAKTLESAADADAKELHRITREHGVVRYHEAFSIGELISEYRLLRAIVQEEIWAASTPNAPPVNLKEAIAIGAGIDVALQEAVLGFTDFQQGQLRAANETESKYLSFLSHDLRNNLNNITLTVDLLAFRLQEMPELAEDYENLVAARRSIWETMEGMDRLMQAERLKRKAVEPRFARVVLHRVVDRVISPMMVRAQDKHLELRNEVPPEQILKTDEQLVTLALQNLVGNAIKYSDHGVIRVRVSRGGEGGNRWIISVSDSGRGIAPEDRTRLFDAFQRGQTHGQAGVGLGLAIVAAAAKLLRAELDVHSEVGKGSTFTMLFPKEATDDSPEPGSGENI